MAAQIGRLSATPEPAVQRTRPRTSTNAAAARLQQTLRRGAERSCRGASAAKLVAGRAIAALVCNGRGCHRSQACRRRSMHLCMIFTCYMILHRHVSTQASQAWRCAAAGHISSMAWASEQWAARSALGLDWLQLVWRCGRLGGARTGSPESTSFIACIHRGERGRLSGLPGGPGAHCRRPNRSVIDRASTVGDAVAPGWSRASLVDATVRC